MSHSLPHSPSLTHRMCGFYTVESVALCSHRGRALRRASTARHSGACQVALLPGRYTQFDGRLFGVLGEQRIRL